MKSSNMKVVLSFFLFFIVAVSTLNIEAIKAVEILQNVVTTTQPGITVEGEIRTIDEVAEPRLWGKGRPDTRRYGTTGVESGLCIAGSTEFGLSHSIVDWGSAANSCPAGTWVCSRDDLTSATGSCNTTRPDTSVDQMACDGTVLNAVGANHWGWVADASLNSVASSYAMSESNSFFSTFVNCDSMAVWCCSQEP